MPFLITYVAICEKPFVYIFWHRFENSNTRVGSLLPISCMYTVPFLLQMRLYLT